MNDIEYIIFDDNHRAIMENGVCVCASYAHSERNARKMNDGIGKALTSCCYRERAIFEWFFGCLVVQSLCRSLSCRCAVIFPLIHKTNAHKYF